jgi:hypothetical protein
MVRNGGQDGYLVDEKCVVGSGDHNRTTHLKCINLSVSRFFQVTTNDLLDWSDGVLLLEIPDR